MFYNPAKFSIWHQQDAKLYASLARESAHWLKNGNAADRAYNAVNAFKYQAKAAAKAKEARESLGIVDGICCQ